jgi:hypothetical protein
VLLVVCLVGGLVRWRLSMDLPGVLFHVVLLRVGCLLGRFISLPYLPCTRACLGVVGLANRGQGLRRRRGPYRLAGCCASLPCTHVGAQVASAGSETLVSAAAHGHLGDQTDRRRTREEAVNEQGLACSARLARSSTETCNR